MKKSRNAIIWTEDFHDNLFLICLELITETYNDILAVVPRRKFNRLSQVIKNNSKNVQFFILNSPYLFHDTSKHSYIKKILNRMSMLVTKIDNYFMLQAKELGDLIENYEMADLLVFEAAGLNFKLLEIINRYDFIQQRIFINHNPDFNGGIYSFFDKFYYLNPNTDLSRSPNTKEQYFLDTMISNKEIIASRKKILKKLNTSKKLNLVVVGYVQNINYNYKLIIDSIPKHLKNKISIVFLGKVIDKEIIEYSKFRNLDVVYYMDFFPTKILHDKLIDSHFLIYAPSANSTHNTISMSSTFLDSSRYCIPVLSTHNVDNFNSFNLIYDDSLEKLIKIAYDSLKKNNYVDSYGLNSINISENKLLRYKNPFTRE